MVGPVGRLLFATMGDVRRGSWRAAPGQEWREINYFEFEHRWTEERKDYPVDPRGDPVRAAAAAALASLAQR